eukprot:CAMPEP_0182440524 /NCGR_PEP_ID=MMETSP1167-20130531/87121_1 /TAXON_ID=2988 /ORGANISM="Mallomonas Sp, Strain CCMP3275" /LENGTH=182 /DNA_ID=CAMNT_0024634505 /DNA_START=455 /DNA_END=999 /DNA_ORIENTATION=-
MEELILHGRLRFSQIKADVLTRVASLLEAQDEELCSVISPEEIQEKQILEDKIQSVFESLVQKRLIVTVPVLDLQKKKTVVEERFNDNHTKPTIDWLKPNKKKGTPATNNLISNKRKRPEMSSDTPVQDLPVELRLMMTMQTHSPATQPNHNQSASSSSAGAGGLGAGSSGSGRGRAVRGRG